jgi:hypothetical protein
MRKNTQSIITAFMEGRMDDAQMFLRDRIHNALSVELREDHELYMSADQMERHLNKLYSYANDKDSFLKTLANYTDRDTCTDKDFRQCSHEISGKGKEFTDTAIHRLEKLIGYTFKPDTVKESYIDTLKRNSLPTPPNVYKNTDSKKLKKGLPKLKKSVYGTGNPPAVGMGGGTGIGGDAGGGGGDGGGGGGAA